MHFLSCADPPNVTLTSSEVIIINSSSVTSVSFSCQVISIPQSTITWIQESKDTTLRQDGKILIQQSTIGNLTTSQLTITAPIMDPDESNYTCSASNNVQNVLGTPERVTGTLYVQGNSIPCACLDSANLLIIS